MINKQEELARQIRREYLNSWRKRNPDKVRKYAHDYWQKKAIKRLTEGGGKADAETDREE